MISSAFYYDKTDFLNLHCNWCSYKASVKPFISHFAVSIKSQEPQQQSFLILDKCNPDGHGLKGRAALTRVNIQKGWCGLLVGGQEQKVDSKLHSLFQWYNYNISVCSKQIYLLAKASGGIRAAQSPLGPAELQEQVFLPSSMGSMFPQQP